MVRCRPIALACPLAAVLLATCLLPAAAEDFQRSTSAARAVRISSFMGHDSNCAGNAAPINLSAPPSHGQVTTKIESATVKNTYTGSAKCTGTRSAATAVYYTPERGFHGTDTFSFQQERHDGMGVIDHSATVTVR